MQEGAVPLEEVEVKDRVPMAQQKGDTTQFNADAFKTLPDADAGELVEKMPTVTIRDGRVQAQGEDVRRVLVDGRPFFGNDPMAALRNLPAEVVEKIQIYDQQSDQAQFSGVEDGETTKTLNIVTRPNMRNGQFGKLFAGYGYDDKYESGGNINFFDGKRRISLIGMSNNVNVQNFSTEDLLGVLGSNRRGGRGGFGGRGGGGRGGRRGGDFRGGGSVRDFLVPQQGGIATTHALGINYSDAWGEKFEITGSYFLNRSDIDAGEELLRTYVDDENLLETYRESSHSDTRNLNHRLNFRIEYQLDSANSFILRPRLSWQSNDGTDNTLGQTFLDGVLRSETDNRFRSDLQGADFDNNLLWRHRFAKSRRTLSLFFSSGYNSKQGESFLQDLNERQPLDQNARLDNRTWNLAANLTYTEPLGERASLLATLRSSYQREESDRQTFDFSDASQDYDLFNEALSNVFSNDYFTQTVGGGYTWRKDRNLMVVLRANFQWARLLNDQTFPQQLELNHTFRNVLPFAMLRLGDRQNNFRLFYRARTQLPSLEQLQNVVDNSNPLLLSTGNPELVQAFQHMLFLRYNATNTEKGSVFFAMLGGGITQDYIATVTTDADPDDPRLEGIAVQPGALLSQPVNLDGYWNLRSFLTYGFPVPALKSNLNLNLSGNFSRTPGRVDEHLNYARNFNTGLGLVLSSNFSRKVDFTLSSQTDLNRVRNSLQEQQDNDYLSQTSRLKFNWVIIEGFVFRNELSHQLYRGLGEGFDQNYWLWSMGVGKKLFKNDRGEITLTVFDLLGQNTSIRRNVTEIYYEDVESQVLQRYFMLRFTYNVRNFRKGAAAAPARGR
ncbi:MAG: TonB-dependent receptor [Bacteroidetes bacterium]|nr:MAG: TonB-dependent receptor [Bacteroidota bacterium]